MENLIVKQASNYPNSQTPNKDSNGGFSYASNYFNSNNTALSLEQEKLLPSYLISSNQSSFDLFSRLEDLNDATIKHRIKNILNLIPTNPKLLESFDSNILKISSASSSTSMASFSQKSASNNLVKSPSATNLSQSQSSIQFLSQSTPNTPTFLNSNFSLNNLTPKKPTTTNLSTATIINNPSLAASSAASSTATISLMSRLSSSANVCVNESVSNTALIANNTENNANLAKFFDKSTQPLNRILYNLETLSSRIMPSSLQDQFNADSYQQDFLRSNGLSVLVSLLKLKNEFLSSPKE
jgi:hypothetical protein